MTDWGRAAMEAFARDRGLIFDGDGLLPAVTPFLRRGLGRGSRRVPVLAKETDYSVKTVGGLTERPERYTLNIARGRLPGGLDGVIAHHFNMERNTRSSDAATTGGWCLAPWCSRACLTAPASHESSRSRRPRTRRRVT
jgi:hypothetical protein